MAPKKHVHPRLQWANSELGLSMESVEEIANGLVPCQILNKCCPKVVYMHRLKADARSESESISNYKVLQDALRYMKVAKIIDVPRLAQGRAGACIDLLTWLEKFCKDVAAGKTDGLVLDPRTTGRSTPRHWTPVSSRHPSPPPARMKTPRDEPKPRPSSAPPQAKSPPPAPPAYLAEFATKLTTRPPGSYTRTTAASVARQQAVAATAAHRASLEMSPPVGAHP
eukprot:CAMPEP_0118928844 /NCGR_PEP_ID=MMETSP1169-20130426/6002_1 /TAXON_ID=36882 /ORGANISM="Pyramimonas obovata, Strain CCMP722" /LENGTH=224 /DNA_ID=CAMNT_0006870911 /DNA_START=332 /DNA_END=1003 /DNA_ORIENTATION=-